MPLRNPDVVLFPDLNLFQACEMLIRPQIQDLQLRNTRAAVHIWLFHAEISPRGTATRNGRRSADLPVVPEQPEPV